jgi:hypothetical protein
MTERVDYYVAAIVDSIEQRAKEGTRGDKQCSLPLNKVLSYYSLKPDDWQHTQLHQGTLLHTALNSLEQLELIQVLRDSYSETILHIPDLQKLFDALQANEPFQRLYILHENGYEWLLNALVSINRELAAEQDASAGKSTPETQQAVSTEDRWEPLALDREDESFEEAVSELQETIRQVAADNGFAAEYPSERDNLVIHAQATLASAREGKVTRLQVKQHLIAAGRWLADKFSGTAIGTLGSELAKWGLRLLGLID